MLASWHFEFFSSLPFWGALLACAVLVRLAGARPRARSWVLLGCSTALLLAIPRFAIRDLVLVWSLASVSFAVSRWLQRPGGDPGGGARRWVAVLGVAAVLFFLAVFKYRWLQQLLWGRGESPARVPTEDPLVPALFLVGVSYFSFKAIHVIVESYKRTITELDPLTYLNYVTFFPSFISGPINRYPQFAPQLLAERPGALKGDLRAGAERIVHGLFKKLVLVPIVFPYIISNPGRPLSQQSLSGVAIGLYAYAAYAYFDFSGYSDLAIGSARILGLQLPENFNWPFLQRNIRDFWTNWHMSLTSWLVDYVYWPVVRKLRNADYFRSRPVLLSVVGMNATFLACGAWHGESWSFVLWGAYHGLGISVLTVYQRQKKRIRNRRVQKYFASRTSRVMGAVAASHYFVLGTLLFALDFSQLRTLAAALFP
jgi:alginate O-acetyltransferase complex protein AlgI